MSSRSMNAAVMVRCSGSVLRRRTCSRAATGMHDAMSRPAISPTSGARPRSTSGGATSRMASSLRGPDAGWVQHRGQPRADADLLRVGDALHRQGLGHVRAADQQLAMDAPGHEEVERAGRDPDRHPQDDRAAAHVEATDPGDLALHLPGGAARSAFVVGAVEQEEERVAAPLEEAGPPVVRLVEQRREHAIERVAHQLGADLALPRESLAEGGEARDVDEDEQYVT